MCFLPYPSIPPPFSYYSAWIPLERSFRYSYSFQSIKVDRAAFHVVLFQYSPTFLALLSVDTARGLILLLFFFSLLFSFLFFFFIFFFEEHWSKLEILALLQCSEKSMSIRRTFPTVSTLSNTRKAGEYLDKEESTLKLKDCFDTQNSICLCSMLTSFVQQILPEFKCESQLFTW